MPADLRLATLDDIPALEILIAQSARGLSTPFYSPAQIEAKLLHVFGVDTQLILDRTYFVIAHDLKLVAAGGWSRRGTLFGGDRAKSGPDPLLDPSRNPARIRAFFVHPHQARRGLGTRILEACTDAAVGAGFRSFELVATGAGEQLYRNHGFTLVDRFDVDLPGEIHVPVARMRKTIGPHRGRLTSPRQLPSSLSPAFSKPPIMNILGIDIGGTGIKGAPVDLETGKFLHERNRIDTPQPATPDAVAGVVKTIVDHFGGGDRVGITFPGIVKNGVTRSAANVDKAWMELDAAKLFVKKLGLPVTVVNDADAAGVAEVHLGAGRNVPGVVLMVTLGTGIGSALFLNGNLVPNTELGHIEVRGKDAEKRASARVREQKELSWKRWGSNVGEYLGRLDALFSPDLFIIGGGVCKKADKFFPYFKEHTSVPIVPAQLLNDAGIVGAALLAHHMAS